MALVLGRILGKGSFGEVRLARWNDSDVAVKVNGIGCADTTAIDRECVLLELLMQHPHLNILRVYGLCDDNADHNVRIVMEYCAGGGLDSYLRTIRERGEVRLTSECRGYCVSFSCRLSP